MSKPIKIYGHGTSPNPWKVIIILEELGLNYEIDYIDITTIKQEPYISINPNGRVPAMEDPNTGVVLWESAAIITYLLDIYDKEQKLHSNNNPDKYYQKQWESFQMSGQGPYYGQKAWFSVYHPEKLPSAQERYANEIKRVLGVIDLHLQKTSQPYLTGLEAHYCDLMFVTWNELVPFLLGEEFANKEWKEMYPRCWEWHQRLMGREGVKRAMGLKGEKGREGH